MIVAKASDPGMAGFLASVRDDVLRCVPGTLYGMEMRKLVRGLYAAYYKEMARARRDGIKANNATLGGYEDGGAASYSSMAGGDCGGDSSCT